MAENDPNRLESWKEIAKFINRDDRTAMRWAKERGMPVHRVPGGKRGGVYASRKEITAWRGVHSGVDPKQESGAEIGSFPRLARREWVWAFAACAFAALVLSIVLISSSDPIVRGGIPSQVKFVDSGFQVLDGSSRELWTYNFPKRLDRSFVSRFGVSLENLVRIGDFRGLGDHEVLVVAPLLIGPNPEDLFRVEVDLFSSRGKLLWSYVPKGSFQFGEHKLEGPWGIYDVLVSDQGPKKAIWVSAIHYIWGNAFVAQLDPNTGAATIRFVNTGVIYKLNELRTSQGAFLLAGGFNNEYDSGSLAIINESKPFAASPQTVGTRHKCVSCTEGSPDYYFVFPRTEINHFEKVYEDSVRRMEVTTEGIEVFKHEDLGLEGPQTIYSFRMQPPIEPVSLRYNSDYDMLHRELSTQKKLNHSLEDCPERLHPKPVRMWTPVGGWTELPIKPFKATD